MKMNGSEKVMKELIILNEKLKSSLNDLNLSLDNVATSVKSSFDSMKKNFNTLLTPIDTIKSRLATLKDSWSGDALKTKVKSLSKSFSNLKKAIKTIKFGDLTPGISKLSIGMSKLTKFNVGALIGAFSGGAKVIGVFSDIIAKYGSVGFDYAKNLEKVKMSFGGMIGSGKEAGKIIGNINSISKKGVFAFPELMGATKAISNFGSTQKEVGSELGSLSNIAAGSGASLGALSEIYGKAKESQQVYMSDLESLSSMGIPIFTSLAESMGVSEERAKQMAENGQIGFTSLKESMFALSQEGGIYAGAMDVQSQSLNSLLNASKEGLMGVLGQIIGINEQGDVIAGGLMDKVKGLLEGFVTFMQSNSESISAFATTVTTLMGGFIETIITLFSGFYTGNMETINLFITQVQDMLSGFFGVILGFWNKHGEDISTVCNAIFTVVTNIIGGVMKGIVPLVESALGIIGGLFGVLSSIINGDVCGALSSLKETFSGVLSFIMSLFLEVKDIFFGLFNGLAEAFEKPLDAAFNVVSGFINKIKDIWDGVKGIFSKLFGGGGNNTVDKAKNKADDIRKKGESLESSDVAGQRALGGIVNSSTPYLVGERGPELFVPNGSGKIIPNPSINSSGLNVSVNMGGVTVNNGADEERLAKRITDKIAKELKYYKMGIV